MDGAVESGMEKAPPLVSCSAADGTSTVDSGVNLCRTATVTFS